MTHAYTNTTENVFYTNEYKHMYSIADKQYRCFWCKGPLNPGDEMVLVKLVGGINSTLYTCKHVKCYEDGIDMSEEMRKRSKRIRKLKKIELQKEKR